MVRDRHHAPDPEAADTGPYTLVMAVTLFAGPLNPLKSPPWRQ